jgi:hypothetical protein
MVQNSASSNEIDLSTFLESAGQSFTDAQKSLLPAAGLSVNMMLSTAELELKVAVSSDAKGRMSIRPISSQDMAKGKIDPGMLSTLRINYVSSVTETKTMPAAAAVPKMNVADVITEVRKKLNLVKQEKAGVVLEVKPSYVAEKNRWLVTVEDTKGKVLNEIVVPDVLKETINVRRTV